MGLDAKKLAWEAGELSNAEWLLALLDAQAQVISLMLNRESKQGEEMMNRLLDSRKE